MKPNRTIMDINDVKTMLAKAIKREKNKSADIRVLLKQYSNADENAQFGISMKIVTELLRDKYIPENLNSDFDYDLAFILIRMYKMLNDYHLLLLGFAVIHHRIMFGDLLDKGEMADVAVRYLTDESVSDLLGYFADSAANDQLYNGAYEQEELSANFTVENLQLEMLRAMYPYVKWLHDTYPYLPLCDNSHKIIEYFDSNQEHYHDKKPALPKFSSFCRFLYQEIYN